MRSPARLSPLNFTRTTLSSFSSSSYVSFSSVFPFVSSVILQLTPSASLLPLSIAFLVLFQSLVVVATPITNSTPLTRQEELVAERTFSNKNRTWDRGEYGSKPVDTTMLRDDPPNIRQDRDAHPSRWRDQFDRVGYLMAENNQFLYIKNNRITGTKLARPKRGILLFRSHNLYLVIQSLHDKTYICMNATLDLYMSMKLNKDCYLKEEYLGKSGSRKNAYKFIQHSDEQPFYLGIDCGPLKGTETKKKYQSSRFTVDDIKDKDVERAKSAIEKGEEESLEDAPVCRKSRKKSKPKRMRKKDKKKIRQKEKKKIRRRWCLNFRRIRETFNTDYEECKQKYCPTESKPKCLCDKILQMVFNPEKTKHKCLVEYVANWVKRRKRRPNRMYLSTFVDTLELVSKYDIIMKRIRERRKMKKCYKKCDKNSRDSTQHKQRHHRCRRRCPKPTKNAFNLRTILINYFSELSLHTTSPTTSVQNDSPSHYVSHQPGSSKGMVADDPMSYVSPSHLTYKSSSSSLSSSSSSSLPSSSSFPSSALSSSSTSSSQSPLRVHDQSSPLSWPLSSPENEQLMHPVSSDSSTPVLPPLLPLSSSPFSSKKTSSEFKHSIRHAGKHQDKRRRGRRGRKRKKGKKTS